MIQSSRSGKKILVTPLELDSMWGSEELTEYLTRYKTTTPPPKDKLLKPQTYEMLYRAVCDSKDLRQRGVGDTAERLLDQLGPYLVKSIYYGFLVGNEHDMETMTRTASPETLKFEGVIVPAVHLLAAHFIANSLLECLNKVANQMMRSAVRTQLRRFVASSGGSLYNYSVALNEATKNRDLPLMLRGYPLSEYMVYYVHPEKYEDMVMEIQPMPLMESDKSEMVIRRLSSKLNNLEAAKRHEARQKHYQARQRYLAQQVA